MQPNHSGSYDINPIASLTPRFRFLLIQDTILYHYSTKTPPLTHPNPKIPYHTMGRHIRALLIPSDGSPHHLIFLKTITLSPTAPDLHLGHHPDLRKYWGPSGWERRVATPLLVTADPVPELNGKYWLFRSLADAHLQPNKHVGGHCFGDAFVVRVVSDGGDGRGDAAYEDVDRGIVGSGLVGRMVGMLGEPSEM